MIRHLDTSLRVLGHDRNSIQYMRQYAPLAGISSFGKAIFVKQAVILRKPAPTINRFKGQLTLRNLILKCIFMEKYTIHLGEFSQIEFLLDWSITE